MGVENIGSSPKNIAMNEGPTWQNISWSLYSSKLMRQVISPIIHLFDASCGCYLEEYKEGEFPKEMS